MGDMEKENEFEPSPCEFVCSELSWKIDELLPSTIEAISPAVDNMMRSLKENCCPPEEAFAVEMVIREALANAVIHGNRQNPQKKVRVCCACDPQRGILIVVKDQGNGFDSSRVLSPVRRQQIHSEHGRGIYLIRSLVDEVQFRHGGSEIYIRKDFHQAR